MDSGVLVAIISALLGKLKAYLLEVSVVLLGFGACGKRVPFLLRQENWSRRIYGLFCSIAGILEIVSATCSRYIYNGYLSYG